MKRQLIVLSILLILTFSIFKIANVTLLPSVKATYVEGEINQDTVWTLVDHPFVLSNNVTVLPDVTLTIEPGVEVRFGGKFSLIVEGILVANGTGDRVIRFTSNKKEPEPGDWRAIIFSNDNPAQQSTLKKCVLEYGENGIVLERGTLKIGECFVQHNSVNGIQISGGTIEVKNNTILNNQNGIEIFGGNQITIQNNNITLNENGISLEGSLTGTTLSIQQNSISQNSNAGILFEPEEYSDIKIKDNQILQNNYGFYISTNTSTVITKNYIVNNTVGIYYASGENHEAHFNDIYDNDMGMDVWGSAAVNATYNYWGDRSGPYHPSLNPKGKGNPVGGDGVNLDFIFFLTKPIDYSNIAPTAVLWTDLVLAAPNQTITFVGTDSYDDGQVNQYFFDFGDGNVTGWITLSLFMHKYNNTGTYIATLKVKDDFGNESEIASTTIIVQDLTPLNVQISLDKYTAEFNQNIAVTVYVTNGTAPVGNANVKLYSIKGGVFSPFTGLTNSTGYFTTTFTTPNVTEVTDVRLIARAFKDGYADGSDHAYVTVLPPMMVDMSTEPATIKSEETATLTVHVTEFSGEPILDAIISIECDNGVVSPLTSVTDINGTATFNFTAPQTTVEINVAVTVTATKSGFAESYGSFMITIKPKILQVEVIASPQTIFSEANSTVITRVTYDDIPIVNATILMASDNGGNFSTQTANTNLEGEITVVFTAPQTVAEDGLNVSITATAIKEGYANGVGQTTIWVKPRILTLEITAVSNTTLSNAELELTVNVKHETYPVEGANVTITSEGTDVAISEITDAYGNATLMYIAPAVNEQTNITIVASATKEGYIGSTSQLNITVNPRTFEIQILISAVRSGEPATVEVLVTCKDDGSKVSDALVTLYSTAGSFQENTATTNEEGYCSFIFNAPQTANELLVNITANVTREGYVEGTNQITVLIEPKPWEWPWTLTLAILIPIIIIAIVVVLIKLKIITVSTEEET
ncbi:PKD domain-containing protein [Candidatus Bathyarchaeota archaeon]|nr:MAG: PKD domain-containing protein [Candidatus Bathyarchaeota archaeon]